MIVHSTFDLVIVTAESSQFEPFFLQTQRSHCIVVPSALLCSVLLSSAALKDLDVVFGREYALWKMP